MSADHINALLRFDALAAAEQMTGASYKDDEATSGLGFAMHLAHSRHKERELRQSGDSFLNMDLADTLALYVGMGFAEVLCDEFVGTSWPDEAAPTESYRILWHPDGLLATVESYRNSGRNSTKVYYNVRVTNRDNFWTRTSSGHFADDEVWVGDHDGREGIRHNLERLREVGDFLPVWIERPWLWLLTYADTTVDGYDYDAINADRVSRLPAHVRDAITPEASA